MLVVKYLCRSTVKNFSVIVKLLAKLLENPISVPIKTDNPLDLLISHKQLVQVTVSFVLDSFRSHR